MKFKEILETLVDKFDKQKEKKEKKKKLIMILTIFFLCLVLILLIITPVVAYQYFYQQKIYSGVYIDGVYVGGLTQNQAITALNQHIDNLKESGLNFSLDDHKLNLDFTTVSPDDPDLAYNLLSFDAEKMVSQAYSFGRGGDFFNNLYRQIFAILNNYQVALVYNLNETDLTGILQDSFSQYEDPGENARIVFTNNLQYEIKPEKNGFEINYHQAITELKTDINLIVIKPITLQTKKSLASVTKEEAEKLKPQIDHFLKTESFVLVYENGDFTEKEWPIEVSDFKNWFSFSKQLNEARLVFDQEKLSNYLEKIAQEINISSEDAKIVMQEGRVVEFKPHKIGVELNLKQSSAKINQEFFTDKKTKISLLVDDKEPRIKTEQINDMGIKEIIGVGVSDFSGSSANRIGNIKNAASRLNGVLIKPDEEFSLVDVIGEVSAATGYFSEWVIKGDRTIKEYGGGLCQIATTTFRAALYSGLPITERKPHSYMVSYYKPIGMDAAIYGPHPDVRFINNTGHYILFQTEMQGNELKFTFWGTSDGRSVEVTDPEVYNWSSPGAAKLIENPDLAPGQKILKEHARQGADAHFYRYLTMPGQEKTEEIWRSHYVAWPAIYEVGLQEVVEETVGENQVSEGDVTEIQNEPGQTSEQASDINSNEEQIIETE